MCTTTRVRAARTTLAQSLVAGRCALLSRATSQQWCFQCAPCTFSFSRHPAKTFTMRFICCVAFFASCLLACAATGALASVQIDFFDASVTTNGVAMCSQAPMQTLTLKGDNSCEAFSVGSSVVYYAKAYCQVSNPTCPAVIMVFYTSAGCPGAVSSSMTWYLPSCFAAGATCTVA
jgi:hypothetical protein